jgi:hypothetical protein
VCSRQRYLWLDAPLRQRKDHLVRRDNQARQARPEIPAKTQTVAERTTKNAWTRKNGPAIKSKLMIRDAGMTNAVVTRKLKNVKTPDAQLESMFIQMRMEERLASRTSKINRPGISQSNS